MAAASADTTAAPAFSGNRVHAERKLNMQKMATVQSTLYVISFTLCWIGPTAFHLIGWIANFHSFAFILILVIFTPLQGFWNCLIYARPTYVRLRQRETHLSRWQVIRRIFLGGKQGSNSTTRHTGGEVDMWEQNPEFH